MVAANSGAGGQSPRRCTICGRELNLFNSASLQWIPPEIVDADYGEIDFLCPTCYLMFKSVYNSIKEQFEEGNNDEET